MSGGFWSMFSNETAKLSVNSGEIFGWVGGWVGKWVGK